MTVSENKKNGAAQQNALHRFILKTFLFGAAKCAVRVFVLFYRNRFCKVAGLIDIAAFIKRDIV